MRVFILLFITVLISVSCEKSSSLTEGLEKYIPRKAAVIILTQDIKDLGSSLRNNDLVTHYTETKLFKMVSKQSSLTDKINPAGETLFCFSKLGRDDYDISIITRWHENLFKKDSLLQKEANLKDRQINSLGSDGHYLIYEDILIASTSRLLLENILREDRSEIEPDEIFDRAYASASTKATANIFIRGSEGASLFQSVFPAAASNPLKDTFSWIAADVDLNTNDLRLNGVVLTKDSTELRLNLLKNTSPVPNRISEITPLSALEISAITYRDWENFKEGKADFLQIDPSQFAITGSELFSTFTEVGVITMPKGIAVVGISSDLTMTQDALASNNKLREYRKVPIYDYGDESAFAKAFQPLLNIPPVKVYTQIEDFFIFSDNQSILETMIANHQNKAVLSQSKIFQNTATQLSDASSLLTIKNLQSEAYKKDVSEAGQKILKNVTLDNYYYAASQLIQEDDYMLFNAVVLKNEDAATATGVTQIANVKLNAAITSTPQLVKNHRTDGMDIVVQDVNNTLYLISNAGKVLWQKELDGQILGSIQQVDLYRNGRLQLAFTTASSFYIIDRNGKDVAPYPLSFKDEITQPLAVFDYDKNRKYRFVVVQNDEILMYNSKAEPVTGFTFTKAPAPVLFTPQHIRMNNKDYILIAETNGKLNILSRTGKNRVSVERAINFGDVPIFKNGNSFQTYDINGNKISINTAGKLSESISDFSSDSKIAVKDFTVTGIRDNELVIGKRKIKVPFGTYATPRVVLIGNKKYTAITNTESNEVFLYDGNGKVLPNFPVYGISRADVGFLERNKSLGFVTQGDARSVLIYRVNQ